ncbi:hypothetical protein [Humibacter sp.]|uniref:hypothetical protein n=1 Tax=Humibacter sp. TaxID=1940291 RepID=UPI003F7FCCA2
MPSPAAAAAATSAPVSDAPAVEVVSSDTPAPLDLKSISDEQLAARYAIPTSDAEPEVVIQRDPAPESQPEAAAEVPDGEDPPAEPEADKEPAAEAPKPITQFALYDGEGEVEVPPLFVSFKAGGKEYEKVPLDKVVRMAQSAPLAERFREAAEKLPTVEQQVTETQTRYEQLRAEAEQNNALYERLLQNPDLYVQAVEKYNELQSPEARAVRAEQEAAALRQQQQDTKRQSETQQTLVAASQYAATKIAPVIDGLAEQYRGLLDLEELTDRFHTLTADLLEAGPNGKAWVPPSKLPEVERRVQTDLTDWAAARANARKAAQTSQVKQADAQVQRAQTDAQMAKRQLARATAPARTAVAPDAPREKPIRTSQDAVEASLERVRRMVQQGG